MGDRHDQVDDFVEVDEYPNCGGEGFVWGCFEDICRCTDDEGLGCAPSRCDWCRPPPVQPLLITAD